MYIFVIVTVSAKIIKTLYIIFPITPWGLAEQVLKCINFSRLITQIGCFLKVHKSQLGVF